MKKNKIFAAVFAVMTAVACTNELDNSNPDEGSNLVPVEFTGVTDGGVEEGTKTTLDFKTVEWEDTDEVTLLSGDGYQTATKLTISGITSTGAANFKGFAENGSSSYIALYPHDAGHLVSNPYNEGGLTVTIPTEQRVSGTTTFQSGANVSVAYSEDNALQFRNIGAVLTLTTWEAEAKRVKKITVKAKKSETEYCKLSGTSVITMDEETFYPIVGEGDKDHVTLLPPEGSTYFPGGTYAFVVYPGSYQGFEITYTDQQDREFTYTNSSQLELKRSKRSALGRVIDPTPVLGSLISADDMTVEVLFNQGTDKWPFIEPIVDAESQASTGDTYTFPYPATYRGKETYEPLTFVISRNGGVNPYKHNNGLSLLTGATSNGASKSITLPGIPGKYLKSVSMQNGSSSGRTFILTKTTLEENEEDISITPANSTTSAGPAKIVFPYTTGEEKVINTEVGRSYKMASISGNTYITTLELVYTATQPVAEE